jgi:alkanesulfonate monooxygenase SsuD/methylene tetrahydromethanopterin reductase-like flavin-dependent oxidoreductase (luciferase family)
VRYALEHAALCGTADRVTEQVAEIRSAGAHHILCQMSVGGLPHTRIMAAMRRFGEQVIPKLR